MKGLQSESDKGIINIMDSFSEEYFDDVFLNNTSQQNLFLNFSKYRILSTSFYPFSKEMEIFLIGDKFGAVTGGLCDMVGHVDSFLPSGYYAGAVEKRYHDRNNLKIYVIDDKKDVTSKYSLGVISFENTEVSLADAYINIADCMLVEGRLLVLTTCMDYETVRDILTRKGYVYQQYFDPLHNGGVIIEASKSNNLTEGISEKIFDRNRRLLLQSQWVKKNGYPYCCKKAIYQDTDILEDVKPIIIDLLKKLVDVCRAHNMSVYPIYGTLLGTIRCGGIIDGDDDIDVAMPREDFDKLILLSSEFDGKYFLQTPENDECFFGGYLKLRNSETTAIHYENWWKNCNEGISIDIFPIDSSYENRVKEKVKLLSIRFLQRMMYGKQYGYFPCFRDMPLLKWKMYVYMAKGFSQKQLMKWLFWIMKQGDADFKKTIYTHYRYGNIHNVRYVSDDAFTGAFQLRFENIVLDIPCGYEEMLVERYGMDYLCSCEFDEYKIRHGYYVSNVPYKEYKKKFSGLNNTSEISKPIIVIGDGSLFGEFIKKYKNRVEIECFVLLPNELKTMKQIDGYNIYSWDEYEKNEVNREGIQLFICSGDVRFAESIVLEKGYSEYYISWIKREWMLFANQSAIWKDIRGMR